MKNLKAYFPYASQSFLDLNTGQAAELEHDHQPDRAQPVRASQHQAANSERFLVRVESVRKRLLDWDNLCEKFHVDCCRYAGILPGDSPAKVKIEVSQRKPDRYESEHTLIEIFKL